MTSVFLLAMAVAMTTTVVTMVMMMMVRMGRMVSEGRPLGGGGAQ